MKLKKRIGNALCYIGVHKWKVTAIGKKNDKIIKMQKCSRCGIKK